MFPYAAPLYVTAARVSSNLLTEVELGDFVGSQGDQRALAN